MIKVGWHHTAWHRRICCEIILANRKPSSLRQRVKRLLVFFRSDNNRESNQWPCYFEADVASVFEIQPEIRPVQLSELDGQKFGRIMFNDQKSILEAGSFSKGLAEGPGKLTIRFDRKNLNEDFVFNGHFRYGCFEGRVRGFNYLPLFDDHDLPIPSNETVLTYVAAQVRGQPIGPIWRPTFSHDGIRTGYFYGENAQKFDNVKDPQNFG